MKTPKLLLTTAALWLFASIALAAGPSLTLTDGEKTKLIDLIQSDDQAKARFAILHRTADAALNQDANPIEVIKTEGKLEKDPVKIRTQQSLTDMPKFAALGYAYAVTGDSKYADKARTFLLVWSKVNHSEGDPIDDTNLEPLIICYDLTHATFSPADDTAIGDYLRGVYDAEYKTGQLHRHTSVNNWNSHRLKIEGLIAFALHDAQRIDQVVAGYKKQIELNLNPGGDSIDFHERDALHYQEYDLTPLLALALAARNNGIDLYRYESPTGSSLVKGVAFLVPFANGSQQHPEFVHSTVEFDRQRAASGQAEYKAGHIWEPRNGLPTIERAQLWQPDLLPLVVKLARSEADRFPTWQIVINQVNR